MYKITSNRLVVSNYVFFQPYVSSCGDDNHLIPFFRTIFSVGNHQLAALHPSAGNDCQ